MRLRDFDPGDLDAVLRLNWRAAGRQANVDYAARSYPDLLQIADVYQGDGAFIVAEHDGAVIAMGAIRNDGNGTFALTRIRVAIPHQRRGHASAIVRELERRTVVLGGSRIVLDTTDRQLPAQCLYESLGYKHTHDSVLENEHGTFNLVHYSKDLGGADEPGDSD